MADLMVHDQTFQKFPSANYLMAQSPMYYNNNNEQ
jgi:hypothetical protein